MGKDSEFYKNKKNQQLLKLRELLEKLPPCARDYIHSKEVSVQTSTLVSYSYDLLAFFEYLKMNNPTLKSTEISKITYETLGLIQSEDIMEFQRYLELNVTEGDYRENGKKAIARKMAPLRGMYEYHYLHGNISSNPMLLVPLPRFRKDKNIIRMNNYEVQAILDAIEHGNATMSDRQKAYADKTRYRDLAILTLLLNTGMRVSECYGLDLDDVDLKVNSIILVRKGGGQDQLYFGEDIHKALEDYLTLERCNCKVLEGHEKALFLSMRGSRLSVDAIENLVKKYARLVVPNKHITPHKLRSTYGTALYRETGDIRLVADVLGHNNINTTIDYYAAMEDEHKREAANAVDFRRED